MQLKFFAGLFVVFAGVAYATPQGGPAIFRCMSYELYKL